MHFGYFGLTLISFYIYFIDLRGALGHFGVLYAVLMRIVGDFRGPKWPRRPKSKPEEAAGRPRGDRRETAGRVQGGCEEGAAN